MARQRAIRLADFSETVRHSLEHNPGRPPLLQAERNAHFRRLLHAERDRIEALHLEILHKVPASADPGGHVIAVFDEIERLSRAVVRGGLPTASHFDAAGVSVTPRCLDLWQMEVAAELEAQNLENTHALRRAMLKIIHEARVAAIAEFRARLADPAAAYAQLAADSGTVGGDVVDDALPFPNAAERGSLARSRAPMGHGWSGRHEGRTAPRPARRSVTPSLDKWSEATVAEAAQLYIAAVPRAGGGAPSKLKRARKAWDQKTRRQFESAAMLLGKAFPGPICRLQQEDLDRFAGLLDRLPARSHHKCQRHVDMSLEAIGDEAEKLVKAGKLAVDQIGLMPPTTNRHFRFLRTLCEWVRKRIPDMAELAWDDYIFADDRDSRDQRLAFTPDQGRMLFNLPVWSGCENATHRNRSGPLVFHDAAFWVPALCWYTGARREEIAKLMLGDVRVVEKIHYLSIAVTPSGGLKNARSARLIPLASELLRLGFLEYVDAIRREGQEVLFPDLLPGTSRQRMGDVYYKRYWRSVAASLPFLQQGQALHAFRHMVSTELKAAEVYVEARSDLLGHASRNPMADRYSKATRLLKLAKIVERIPVVTASLQSRPMNLCKRYWPKLPTQAEPIEQVKSSAIDHSVAKVQRSATDSGMSPTYGRSAPRQRLGQRGVKSVSGRRTRPNGSSLKRPRKRSRTSVQI